MALLQQPFAPVSGAPAPDDVVARLDEELRAAVRRDGIDPQREVGSVRRLASALVREHDERSLTGVVAPVADAEGLVAELVARVAGFGALQPFLDDPSVEEVWIYELRQTKCCEIRGPSGCCGCLASRSLSDGETSHRQEECTWRAGDEALGIAPSGRRCPPSWCQAVWSTSSSSSSSSVRTISKAPVNT